MEIMNTVECLKKKCTGCAFCETVCPTQAISFEVDEEGFLQPKINLMLCSFCGNCYDKCILSTQRENMKPVNRVYAAFSLDLETRNYSTSGGVFTELAKVILQQNGIVIGAAYQEDFSVKHEVIYDAKDISRLSQSKYVQSDVRHIYSLLDDIDENAVVLFVGTPCQIVAFQQYMKKKKNPAVYIDFICRGVNSPRVFKYYLNELQDKNKSKITKVWFKNKENGWNNFKTRVEFENGTFYAEDRITDAFMRGFLKHNLYMRKSCYECSFKGEKRVSDITLADFWGVEFDNSQIDIEKGVSAVLIHSETGQKLFSLLKNSIYFEERCLEDIKKRNLCIDISIKEGDKRTEFYRRLKNEAFSKIIYDMEERK